MKKKTLIASVAMISFASFLVGEEDSKLFDPEASICSKKKHNYCDVPLGAYYVDLTSTSSFQVVTISNPTASVQFSGLNADAGVVLSGDGTALIIPKRGYYKIEWDATISVPSLDVVSYHFNLQKNGVNLHPTPQVAGIFSFTVGAQSAAASVIVPLCPNDQISLVLTLDSGEGGSDSVVIQAAQISATWLSKICD